MTLIYDLTHTFSSYVIFGGLFVYLFYLLCSKFGGAYSYCTKFRAKFMWLVLLIPFITYLSLQVLFPRFGAYQERLIYGTVFQTIFEWACQVGYWSSLLLTPVLFVWLAVIVIRLCNALLSGRKVRQLYQPAAAEQYPRLFAIVDELCGKLGMRRPDVFVVSNGWLDSFAFGLVRPGVVIDRSILELDYEDIKAIIAHELAHVYRKDAFFSVIIALLRDLMFFSPAAHWAYKGLMAVKEELADETAVNLIEDRLQYGSTLIKVWKARTDRGTEPTVYPAFGIAYGNLARRVEQIINPVPSRKMPALAMLVIVLVVMDLLSFIC
ncbi:MAG: M56 family metallopeptidase [Thermoanaerobacteraceae bacterium]|nr:M56 family metallopeptidase [Thermoanaerobacteraceae bacterium]